MKSITYGLLTMLTPACTEIVRKRRCPLRTLSGRACRFARGAEESATRCCNDFDC
jgi:hypothetical protein